MWVECESGELLNLDRADKVVIARDLLIATVNEPEQWVDLGVICSLKGRDEEEKKATLGHLARLMEYALGNVISFRSILMKFPG